MKFSPRPNGVLGKGLLPYAPSHAPTGQGPPAGWSLSLGKPILLYIRISVLAAARIAYWYVRSNIEFPSYVLTNDSKLGASHVRGRMLLAVK